MKDRTGRTVEWINCDRCVYDTENKAWKTIVGLDINPHSTLVIEGALTPEKEQIIQVRKEESSSRYICTAHCQW
jgi:hypothetical protein